MTRKHRFFAFLLVLVPSVLLLAGEAAAFLQRVGPLNPAPSVGNYPAWYQDNTLITLEFCDPINDAELDGGWCLIARDAPGAPGVLSVPETFPTNFVDEHFYYSAAATTPTSVGDAALEFALEAAFAAGVAPGGQIVFARIRTRIDVTAAGDYRVIHPYGEILFNDVTVADGINFTDDVGLACAPGTFDCALSTTNLGPFLLPSATAGGPEDPPNPQVLPRASSTSPFRPAWGRSPAARFRISKNARTAFRAPRASFATTTYSASKVLPDPTSTARETISSRPPTSPWWAGSSVTGDYPAWSLAWSPWTGRAILGTARGRLRWTSSRPASRPLRAGFPAVPRPPSPAGPFVLRRALRRSPGPPIGRRDPDVSDGSNYWPSPAFGHSYRCVREGRRDGRLLPEDRLG